MKALQLLDKHLGLKVYATMPKNRKAIALLMKKYAEQERKKAFEAATGREFDDNTGKFDGPTIYNNYETFAAKNPLQ